MESKVKATQIWSVQNRKDYDPPSLYHPYGITINADKVILAEGFWPYSRIQIFNLKGRSLETIGQGEILPFGVACDPQTDNFYITDHRERTVKCFSSDSQQIFSWDVGLFEWPTGIAVDESGTCYVTDWSKGELSVHNKNGLQIRKFKTTGISSFSCPVYVAVDANKRIFVTDLVECCAKVFSNSGKLITKIGHLNGPGKLLDPRGICVDQSGNIIVADWGASKVKSYSSDGIWIEDILDADDGIKNPWGVSVKEDYLAVSEQKLNASPTVRLFRMSQHSENELN